MIIQWRSNLCPDCHYRIADQDDDGNHNTGECGCKEARSLCWRKWNNNKCSKNFDNTTDNIKTIKE